MNVLSIDWDFFINADLNTRALLFPDGGNENLPKEIKEYVWDVRYRDPRLKEIGIDETAFLKMYNLLSKVKAKKLLIADSHKHIYDFIVNNIPDDLLEPIHIVNFDFHHDNYHYRTNGDLVNCGNWLTILEQEQNVTTWWVKCPTSDTNTIGGEPVKINMSEHVDYFNLIANVEEMKCDLVFLCRSGVWSPPHLDNYFCELVDFLLCHNNIEVKTFEAGIDFPRSYESEGKQFPEID